MAGVKAPQAPAVTRSALQMRGAAAEERAFAFLQEHGLKIVARNVRYRVGEIDAVARDGPIWVFAEVRSRRHADAAAASIGAAKQGRIRRAAQSYPRSRFRDRWPACRFDVILVDSQGIEWLASAFGEDGEP